MKFIPIIVFIFFYSNTSLFAQNNETDSIIIESAVYSNHYTCDSYKAPFYNIPKQLLLFYKRVISEQLSAVCEFEPSCSSFSLIAFETFNPVKAYFLTADRLMRCGVSMPETQRHLINIDHAKIIDHPDMYRFK